MDKIVVLASGSGTNFQAIVEAIERGDLEAEVALLVTDRPGIPVLARAARAHIPATLLDRSEYGQGLSDAILRVLPAETKLIVLAGFLSILRGDLLQRFRNRIINLHPALLPRHGGPGMYGHHVHHAVLAAGDTESGCTVHYVDEGTDTGPILLQRRLTVAPDDTVQSLAERIAVLEHEAIVDGTREALRR